MGLTGLPSGFFFLIIFILILAAAAIKILREYERGVIFRLGRLIGAKGPGIIFIIPGVDKLMRIRPGSPPPPNLSACSFPPSGA